MQSHPPHMRWADVKENQFSACSVSVTSSSLSYYCQRIKHKISTTSEFMTTRSTVQCFIEAAFLAVYLCYEDGQVYNTRSLRYSMNPPGGVPSVPGDNYLAAPSL